VWIGSSRCGITEYHPDNGAVFNHTAINTDPLLSGNAVLDMMDDGEYIWIGTIHGLLKFNKQSKLFTHFDFGIKPPPAMFSNLFNTGDGRFWMTCTEGLIRFNPTDSSMRLFNVHHGLSTNSFHYQTAFQTWDGFLCLPSFKGLVIFKPQNTENMDLFPTPVMTSIRILNSEIDMKLVQNDELHLAYNQNFFTIVLNTFDYLRQGNVRYSYMLKGLHDEWVQNGTNRELTFTAIPGGDYELFYRATTTEGYWPDEYKRLIIHVETVYYKKWWFRLSIIILTSILIYLVYSYRKKLLKKEEALRQKIASDLHDDIGATLSSIRMYSEVALSRKGDNEPLLKKISENAKGMVDSMSDMVWAIKPGKEKFSDLHQRLLSFAQEMCGPTEIELHFRVDDSLSEIKLSMEHRKDIYLVFKEAINNAVKYSECRHISVNLHRVGSTLHLDISDDGKGFNTVSPKRGNGLENMKTRITNLHGKFIITSAENKGTKIHCEIPLTHIG
jgi:two-component sensor histidine kinase